MPLIKYLSSSHPQLQHETTSVQQTCLLLNLFYPVWLTGQLVPLRSFLITPESVHHAIEQHKLKIAHKDEDFFLRHRLTLRSEIPRRQVSKQRSRWDAMANTESQSVTSMRLMAPKRRPVRIETSNDPTQYSKLWSTTRKKSRPLVNFWYGT